jgi:Zinc knuckle
MTENETPANTPTGSNQGTGFGMTPNPGNQGSGFGMPPPPPPPTYPKMGGISGGDPFTGGAPNLAWTTLANPNPRPYSLLCLRPRTNNNALKAMLHIIKAPTTLFSKGMELIEFAEERARHFEKTGLDTIMYLPSQADPTKMVNVLEDYGQVTLQHVIEQSALYKLQWDDFDIDNDRWAIDALEASIDETLAKEIRIRKESTDTAAVLWMRILALCEDGSIEKYNRMKDQLKALTPSKEAGEDVVAYSSKVRKLCHSLVLGKQFEFVLIISIVKALCSVSVESFRSYFLQVRNQVDKVLKEIAFSTTEHGLKRMRELKLDHTSILDEAETQYKSLFDNDEWDPAKMVKDLTKAPTVLLGSMTMTQFNTLVQNCVGTQKDTRTCFTCGKPGHIAKDCPQKNTGAPSSDGATAGATTGTGTQPTGVSWRDKPPPPGGATTKVWKGNTFHFCPKCNKGKGRWTKSHNEAGHHGLPPESINQGTKSDGTTDAAGNPVIPHTKPETTPATIPHGKLATSETFDLLWGP